MSIKIQEKHMRRLAELVRQNLSHIYGERELGPNGAKKEYLQTGKAFLRTMARDLGLVESNVYDTKGGIGTAGEICLMGMFNAGNGIHIYIQQSDFLGCILYRRIAHIKDYDGDYNRFLTVDCLLGGYANLLNIFKKLSKEGEIHAEVY